MNPNKPSERVAAAEAQARLEFLRKTGTQFIPGSVTLDARITEILLVLDEIHAWIEDFKRQ